MGSSIGIIVRLILTIAQAIGTVYEMFAKLSILFWKLFDSMPEPLQKALKIIVAIGLLIMAGPVGAVIALIAALDDLFTYLRGGKSVIGSFFEGIFGDKKDKNSIANVGNKVKDYNTNYKNNNVPSSYATTNNTSHNTTTANSNNQVSNTNNIKVYGSSDPKATGKATANVLTGISIRNLQGVL